MLWIPTHLWFEFLTARLNGLEIAMIRLYHKEPANKGVISGLIMHLIRSIESTPTEVPSHVRQSLKQLQSKGWSAVFGMMFLHGLDLRIGTKTLDGVRQKDDRDIVEALSLGSKRPKPIRQPNVPSLEFPLGKTPTWAKVKETMKSNPLSLVKAWNSRPRSMYHVSSAAGVLFVKFTKSIWASLKSQWVVSEGEIANIDQGMEAWSALNVSINIAQPVFWINRSGLKGAVPGGREAASFSRRTKIYFPDLRTLPPSGSKWTPFLNEKVGYIHAYHTKMDRLKTEEQEALDEEIKHIFFHLQCLPDSEPFTSSREGRTWGRAKGEEGILVLVNGSHLKLIEFGVARNRGPAHRPHVTRANKEVIANLYQQEGLIEDNILRDMRAWGRRKKRQVENKSKKTKNKRVPPPRRRLEKEGSSSSSSSSSSSEDED